MFRGLRREWMGTAAKPMVESPRSCSPPLSVEGYQDPAPPQRTGEGGSAVEHAHTREPRVGPARLRALRLALEHGERREGKIEQILRMSHVWILAYIPDKL